MDDHRRFNRSEVATLVKIESGGQTLLGTSLNISLTGLGCELTQDLQSTKPVLVSFRLSLKDRPITTWAEPIWSSRIDDKWRVGFKYVELDSAHHRAIADYLSEIWQQEHNLA